MKEYQHLGVAQHRMSMSKQGEEEYPCRGTARDGALTPKQEGIHGWVEGTSEKSQGAKQGELGVHTWVVAVATTED